MYDARDHVRGVPPASVTVGAIGVRDSPIVGVGVDENGAFAVPGVSQVGWYEFGPRPGDPGSSVLAGHIAFGGVDGVFRRLASTKVGGDVVVRFVDGSSVAFVVTRVERIDKDELPAELFASSGPAQLVLISCGGAFNREQRFVHQVRLRKHTGEVLCGERVVRVQAKGLPIMGLRLREIAA